MREVQSAAEPIWSRTVEAPVSPPARIIIEGPIARDGFQPAAVRFPDSGHSGPVSTALLPGHDILPLLNVRAFGLEERVEHHSSNGGVMARCAAGRQPAGLVLSTGSSYFPRRARSELVVSGETSVDVGISIIEAGEDAPAEPMAILHSGQTTLAVPPAGWFARPQSHEIVLTCPADAAEILIRSVVIAPGLPPEPTNHVGTWIWHPEIWIEQQEAVLRLALEADLDRIYLQLRVEDGLVAEGQALAAFIEQLGRHGVEVYAVEGDPAMAIARGREHALTRVAAIARYQADAPPGMRLAGIQFDIEPYLLETYSSDAAGLWRGWAESIEMLSQVWGAPVSVVVPFWMLRETTGHAALGKAQRALSQVVVMAYRTAPDEVFALSEPWLSWGAAHGLPIAIALENGVLPVEVHQTYARAETGTLILSSKHGRGRLTLHSDHITAPEGGLAYTFGHETRVDPSRISFMKDRRHLSAVRSQLLHLFGAWSSFDGLMLHELGVPDGRPGNPPIRSEDRTDEQAHDPGL